MTSQHFARRLMAAVPSLVLSLPLAAEAQTAPTVLPPVTVESAPDCLCGSGEAEIPASGLQAGRQSSSSAADLMRSVPGAQTQGAGGVSSLPVLRGMADDRNKVTVDGAEVTSSCSNHMNPALSYSDPQQVTAMTVVAGIPSVSLGGDSIGGTIAVRSADPRYAKAGEKLHVGGTLSSFYRSNSRTLGGSAAFDAATETVSAGASVAGARARAYHDGDGNRIATSQYATSNEKAHLGIRNGDHQLVLRVGSQFIPYEGFPNQRMDLLWNRGRTVALAYDGTYGWGTLDANAYWQNVKHYMNFLREKSSSATGMPMKTDGTDSGYSIKATLPFGRTDTLRVGHDVHRYLLNDWWPPTSAAAGGMMSPNNFQTINGGTRDIYSGYAEWERKISPSLTGEAGLRLSLAEMNTGTVQGYSNNAMAAYAVDAAAFNRQNHHKQDVNLDGTALLHFVQDQTSQIDGGLARKTRSPSLYERYTWSTGGSTTMSPNMINWFGDANGYVGNLNLRPETAYTASISPGWHDASRKDWSVTVTPYYTYVQNFIGVNLLSKSTTNGVPFYKFQFANHDSWMAGFDLSGEKSLWQSGDGWGHGRVKTVIGFVHGEQVNTGKSLYHMMPLNARTTLEQTTGNWRNEADLILTSAKSSADSLRESHSPGYALINLRTSYVWNSVTASAGVENLFNKQYYHPLSGMDYASWKERGQTGDYRAVAGEGRSFTAGVTVKF